MKKILLTFVMVLGFLSSSFTQESADIIATAKIISEITITGDRPLNFGEISSETTKTISPDAGESGRFTISASRNTPKVTIDFTLPTELSHETGKTPINIDDFRYILINNESPSGNGDLIDGVIETSLTGQDNTQYLYIGATISGIDSNTEGGNYSGDITITVDYN